MGKGLEVITSFVTAPGAAFPPATANAACSGNSLQIRSAQMNSSVKLLGIWSFNQVAGTVRTRSPRMHDNVNGIRSRVPAASVLPKYPMLINMGFPQFLIPQDTLVVEQSGSAVAGQIESTSHLVYYDSLPGVSARLITGAQLMQYGINVATVQTTITAVVTGQYGGALALNAAANSQNLKANTDYALVGACADTRGTTIQILGVDFGNLGVGVPCEPSIEDITSAWFVNLALAYNLPLIPVFNTANAGNTTVAIQTNQAGGTYIVDLYIVELQPGTVQNASSGPNA